MEKLIRRIVISPAYSCIRYAEAFELKGNDIIKTYGNIAEGLYEIIEDCESWGIKHWGAGIEIVANCQAGSEVFNN